ncbi:MAG: response regulator, partial [bacterium]|nr:response regulator [bacterium]
MADPLNVLVIEDSEDDALLMVRRIRRAGYAVSCTRVDTADSLRETMKRKEWDIVLSDYSMLGFNGLEALKIVRAIDSHIPFILVSGAIGEELAVTVMRSGAQDYIMKDNLTRLAPAVKRELEEAGLRLEKKKADGELKLRNMELAEINKRLRKIVETTRELSYCMHVEKFSSRLLEEFGSHMFAAGGSLYLVRKKGLERLHTLDPGHSSEFIPFPLKKGTIFERVMSGRAPVLIETVERDRDYTPSGWHGYTDGSVLAFPLPDEKEKIIGVLSLHSKVLPPFVEQDKEIGEILATYCCESMRATQMAETLQESEGRLELALKGADLGLWDWDLRSNRVVINRRWAEMLGYEAGDIEPTWDIFNTIGHPHDREEAENNMKQHLSGKIPYYEAEYRLKSKDGSWVWVLGKGKVMESDKKGKPLRVVGTHLDITERKHAEEEREKLENQLRQSKKMEAIGTLAGGIAHDFNNLLMGIQGRVSMMLKDIDASYSIFEGLKGIEEHIKSASDLTKQLLAFARGGKYEVRPVDLNDVVKKTSNMFGRTKKEVKFHKKYQKNIRTVEVDRSQIEQLLLNLYVNAWHSMPDGGDLFLQVKNDVLREEDVLTFGATPGDYVKISVTDTGVGMDEATMQRIFEPFFTTREMGRGIGMGLASVYGIVKNHKGIIKVHSKEGEGAVFDVYLPVSDKEIIKEKKPLEKIVKGRETILMVDDEDFVLDVGVEMLGEMGYTVLAAAGGKEALEVFQKNRERIDMVILDMIMPEIGGGETFNRLKKLDPGIKVLLSSGFSLD